MSPPLLLPFFHPWEMALSLQWQIDLPSLSQLVMIVGAHGLKQLALAGIDIHSIGCLHLIANSTPTCLEYREELNRQREIQRREAIWLYKIVEIGGATNFLADQLLKTRAGENVLALLSTLIPFVPEKALSNIILSIFDQFGIPADSTPGVNQIGKIRAALTSFVMRMTFKDRVLQYHTIFSRLLSKKLDPDISIPAPEIVSRILSALLKVATCDGQYIVHYSGILGAAWTATFSWRILGLSTCAIAPDGEVVPLSASDTDASVVFFLAQRNNEISLWERKNIKELISTEPSQTYSSTWLVSCDRVNFVRYHLPNIDSQSLDSLSNLVVLKTFETIQQFLDMIPKSGNSTSTVQTFMTASQEDIQDRAIDIVRILGFKPQIGGYYRARCPPGTSQSRMEVPMANLPWGSEIAFTEDPLKRYMETPSWMNLTSETVPSTDGRLVTGQSPTLPPPREPLVERTTTETHSSIHFNLSQAQLLDTVDKAVRVSATLAFTDWNQSHHLISSSLFNHGPLQEPMLSYGTLADPPFEQWQQEIMHEALGYSTNMTPAALEKKLWWVAEWLGQDYDGIVVLRHLACSQNLRDRPGCLATFHPGHILLDGQRFEDVREELFTDTSTAEQFHPLDSRSQSKGELQSEDYSSEFELQSVATSTRDTIWIRSLAKFKFRSSHVSYISPSRIANNTTRLLVSSPCPHSPADPPAAMGDFVWEKGLLLKQNQHRRAGKLPVKVIIQQVGHDNLGKWLAVHARDVTVPQPCIQVLQGHSCVNCVVDEVVKSVDGPIGQIVIIPDPDIK